MSGSALDTLQDYLKEHQVEDLVFELVESLLKDKPANPRKYLWSKLGEEETLANVKASEASIMEVPSHHLQRLFEATRLITKEVVPRDTVNVIIEQTVQLLDCDRVSLFVHDRHLNMLVLSASNLTKPIRVALNQGIAGTVFVTKQSVNIPDCYADPRFDQTFDRETGYRTKNLLCVPILDFEGESAGVLQAINKQSSTGAAFNQIDELLMAHLSQQAGIALRNAEVYREAIQQGDRANALVGAMSALSHDLGAQSVILAITMHSTELVQADRCTVYLVDEPREQLWSCATDSGKELRIPMNAGIAGECRATKQTICIADAYQDARFNQEMDRKTGYHTRSILAVPILSEERSEQVVGVIQMINKIEFDGEVGAFPEEDVRLIETFAKFLAPRVAKSVLTQQGKKMSEAERSGMRGAAVASKPAQASARINAIAEGDEDDE
eukprot:CAMPEP_0204331298 /NCGR_PEP_ID=MMETSP0469-20131031/15595_1 /ASSEMBLY_ACC=CAM_ASM_000384 /TAXON_ID=2969 /ORGANISM="Oxyrrhis marina" /LENGTH=440 /DNA_ID=CAMNT_0051314271 /DNA_START=24 /DNA_END=1346 /DNA_ORIENTATION=+